MAAICVALLVITTSRSRAIAAQQRWGSTVEVAVVTQAREAGEPIEDRHITFRFLPVEVVPVDAIERSAFLSGVAAGELRVGDVLRNRDLVDLIQEIPPRHRGIAVATGPESPTLVVGDRVELFVFGDRFAHELGVGDADVISGRVIEAREGSAIVAVPEDVAPDIAAGLVNGAVVLAATGP